MGLPWCFRLLRTCLRCGRPRFDLWIGKISWRREQLPTPVFLPGEYYGQRSLVGYSPWGRRVRHNWVTNTSTFNKLKTKHVVDVNFSVSAVDLALQNSFGNGVPKHSREATLGLTIENLQPNFRVLLSGIQIPLKLGSKWEWNWEVNHVFQSLPSHHAPLVSAHSLHLLGISIHQYGVSNIITVPLWVIFHHLICLLHHHGASHFNMVNFEKQCYIFLDPSENLIKALGLLPQKSTQHVSSNSGWFTGPGWEQVHWFRDPKDHPGGGRGRRKFEHWLVPHMPWPSLEGRPHGNFWRV